MNGTAQSASTADNTSAPAARGAAQPGPTRGLRGWFLALLFAGWGIPLFLITAVLMVGHWVTLPVPAMDDPALNRALAALPENAESTDWTMVHVLYSKCRCSKSIVDYLLKRERPAGVSELLLLVGRDETFAKGARAAGFAVEELTREALKERFNIESAPLLLMVDPRGQVRYSGGYTNRKQGRDFQDLALLSSLRSSAPIEALPAYGCAVSDKLQAYLDPIGVKY